MLPNVFCWRCVYHSGEACSVGGCYMLKLAMWWANGIFKTGSRKHEKYMWIYLYLLGFFLWLCIIWYHGCQFIWRKTMTSWHGNALQITCPLSGSSLVTNGQKGSLIRNFYIFVIVFVSLNILNKLSSCWLFETNGRPCDATVMSIWNTNSVFRNVVRHIADHQKENK